MLKGGEAKYFHLRGKLDLPKLKVTSVCALMIMDFGQDNCDQKDMRTGQDTTSCIVQL